MVDIRETHTFAYKGGKNTHKGPPASGRPLFCAVCYLTVTVAAESSEVAES